MNEMFSISAPQRFFSAFCSESAVLIRTGRWEAGDEGEVDKHANEPDRLAD